MDTTGFIFFFYSPKSGLFPEPAPEGALSEQPPDTSLLFYTAILTKL
jgi:hypothetical protein